MTEDANRLKAIQIGLTTCDMAGSLRLYSDLGFKNAGGHMIWGQPMAIQGLSPSSRGMMWWLVGKQERVQLELFHHSNPQQRPLPPGWRCCDLGWTRFGVAVPDLEAAKAALEGWKIPLTGEMAEPGDVRRLAFRDPFVGCFIEVIEEADTIPGGPAARHHDADSSVVYMTSSVSDLTAARAYYEDILKLETTDENEIHRSEHEALWGLEGARSESFVVKAGGFLLEIVKYLDPVGRPRREDYRVTDQGIMNVAVASPDRAPAEQAIDRAKAAGLDMTDKIEMGEGCGAYVLEAEREVEICSLPRELEESFGFVPASPFFGQMF